jgi:hypothetical protein
MRARIPPSSFIAVTLVLFAGDLALLATSYSDAPFLDDFTLVPVVTGEEPPSVEWLLRPHYGHHIPLLKLWLFGAARLSHGFGLARVLDLLLLLGSAVAYGLASRGLRGRGSHNDVAFALLFLHPGLTFSFFHTFDAHFLIPTTLLGAFVYATLHPAAKRSRVVGGAVLAIPAVTAMCGVNGILVGAALGVWLLAAPRTGVAGVPRWVSRLAGAAALLVGAALFPWDARPMEVADPSIYVRTTLQFQGMGLGPAYRDWWPYGAAVPVALVVLALLVAVTTPRAGRDAPLYFLVTCFVACLAISFAVGFGRAVWGSEEAAGLYVRYAGLAAPLLALAQLLVVWKRRTDGRARWAAAEGALPVVLAFALLWNVPFGLREAAHFRDGQRALQRSVDEGRSARELVEEHGLFTYPYDAESLETWFEMLKRWGGPPFGRSQMSDEP